MISKVVLDEISDNMALLVQFGKYGTMNTIYTSLMRYFDINFVSEAYTLQDDTACDRQIISSGELFFKGQYLIFVQ